MHGKNERVTGERRIPSRTPQGKGEKDGELTGDARACSERLEEGRSGRISPVTGGEEEDTPVAALDAGSIPSPGTFLAVGRSSWESLLGSL
jgi:hypothetical protein